MSIAENLALAAGKAQTRGLGWALPRKIIQEIKRKIKSLNLGLEERLSENIGGLSGGERQALTLLMATWVKPELLLLDEHTAALDPNAAEIILRLSEELVRENRLTTLMVTNSMRQAVTLGSRLLMLHRGKIVHDFKGEAKQRLQVKDLLAMFDEVKQNEDICLH